MIRHLALACFALLTLTACDTTQSLRELREVTPVENPFHSALATGYKQFAEELAADYDWSSSQIFADKGLMAAYGRDIEPEKPADWQITSNIIGEFNDARAKLLEAVTANKDTQPSLAAASILAYDRWVLTQHNNTNAEEITQTKDAFFANLGKLLVVQAAEPGTNPPISEPVPEPVKTAATILYFPFDSDDLGDSAKSALDLLMQNQKVKESSSISINGHTDRAGTDAYNMDLSQRRASRVEKALEALGVPASAMQYFAFGESDPAVPTEDGVREPRNRRVEIFLE